MSQPTHISVDINDLRYLYYTADAAVNSTEADDDTFFALASAHRTALQIASRILGVAADSRQFHGCIQTSTAPRALPHPGSVDRNPLMPDPPVEDAEDDAPPLTGVVYGIAERHQSFALIDDREAETRSAEISAISGCQTLGELRSLVPTLTYGSPIDPADYPYELDSCLIDISEWCEYWPPMVTQYALDDLPGPVLRDLIEETGGEEVWTTHDGPYLCVPLERESDLLAVLHRHGLQARRDDGLIAHLDPFWS